DWKRAKKPASQMTSEMVDSLSRRSRMEVRSSWRILSSELRSTGLAYCALQNQMKTPSTKTSPRRLATNTQRTEAVRGYAGWSPSVGAHQKYPRLPMVMLRG